MKKKTILIVLAVMIAVVVFMPISFVKIGDRGVTHDYFPEGLKGRIDAEIAGYSDDEIVKYSLELTAELLRFTRVNALKDGKISFFDPSIYDVSCGLHKF